MSCPSLPPSESNTPFGSSSTGCRYHEIQSRGPADTPRASLRIREPAKINAGPTKYLHYSVLDAKEKLDLSFDYAENASVFPRNLYKKNPFAYSASYLIIPRDIDYMYTYSPDPNDRKERSTHPERASRFGYDRFPNEYGVGVQTRGYVEPLECHACAVDTPPNMAPQRFYNAYNLENTPTEGRKMAIPNYNRRIV